jgi:ribulose-bisphosphate carboxylase large chain
VVLTDVALPQELLAIFGGPRHGLHELRRRVGAPARALTCSPLKPQGVPAARLAELAKNFAQGGVDYIKDDHGLADQDYSPFAARVDAVAAALRRRATCRASRAISTPCARRSCSPKTPASIPSWSRR